VEALSKIIRVTAEDLEQDDHHDSGAARPRIVPASLSQRRSDPL
jgi:hypothetical protein